MTQVQSQIRCLWPLQDDPAPVQQVLSLAMRDRTQHNTDCSILIFCSQPVRLDLRSSPVLKEYWLISIKAFFKVPGSNECMNCYYTL